MGEVAGGPLTTPPGLEFADWAPLDPNDPVHMDVATDFAGSYGFLGIQLRGPFGQIN